MTQDYDTPPQFEGTVSDAPRSGVTAKGAPFLKVNFYLIYRGYDNTLKEPVPWKTYYTFTLWRDEAEEAERLIQEGQRIRLTGYPLIRKYKDRDGVEQIQKTTEIANPKVDLAFLRTQAGLIPSAEDDEDTTAAAAIADLL